eukprot:9506744-Alexandrium_andersonii.AAC.1
MRDSGAAGRGPRGALRSVEPAALFRGEVGLSGSKLVGGVFKVSLEPQGSPTSGKCCRSSLHLPRAPRRIR